MGKEEQKRRFERLTGPHLLWASTMGATLDLGVMNKAMITPAMKTTAQRLVLFQMQRGTFPFADGKELNEELFKETFRLLNEFLYFSDKYDVVMEGNTVNLRINKDACMYCPSAVGGAPSDLHMCPYPHLFSVYLDILIKNTFHDKAVKIKKEEDGSFILQEEEDIHTIRFHIEDDPEFKEICDTLIECKKEIEKTFTEAIENGVISEKDLWDRNYVPVPNTNPQKYKTKFTYFARKYIQPIEDKYLEKNRRFIFVVLVDENGYLPAHNTKYDKPLTGDYKKDLIGNRSMRIFNDPTGLAAARNEREILLQPYPRDVGVLMYDISTPIYLNGKHWGGLRIGFK